MNRYSILRLAWLPGALFCGLSGPALALGTARLGPAACDPDVLFNGGFDEADDALTDPSGGSGGELGSNLAETIVVGDALRPYLLRVPPDYSARRPVPAVVLLHGAAGPNTAMTSAVAVRNLWSATADAAGALLVVPVGSGSQGSWVPAVDIPVIEAVIAEVESHYDLDRNRIHAWGYSSGGHLAHGLALDRGARYAAYAVNAGVLAGYAGQDAPGAAERKPPLASYIGLEDPLLANARLDDLNFRSNGWIAEETLRYVEFPGGHGFPTTNQVAEIWRFLCPWALQP